jgi:hypothetical protein
VHGTTSVLLPAPLPLPKARDRFLFVLGLVEEFWLLQTHSLGGFEPALQVAQLVHPNQYWAKHPLSLLHKIRDATD